MPKGLGVLVSGTGTNLQALLDATLTEGFPARVAVVVSNVPTAPALERARRAGVPALCLEQKNFPSRPEFERALAETCLQHGAEIVCLAGFMRLLGKTFLDAFPSRVVNIHPALLPAFPGLHAVRAALAHGTKLAGCTVHLVDEGTDTGPILAQAAVPVLPEDDEGSLAARIQVEEHRLYPLAVRLLAEGKVNLDGRRAKVLAEPLASALSLRNPGQ